MNQESTQENQIPQTNELTNNEASSIPNAETQETVSSINPATSEIISNDNSEATLSTNIDTPIATEIVVESIPVQEEIPAKIEEIPIEQNLTEQTIATPIENKIGVISINPKDTTDQASEEAKTDGSPKVKRDRPYKPYRREIPEIDKEKLAEILNKLKEFKEKGEAVEVVVKTRIRGGLRVAYDDFLMFLPASHFAIRRTPSEEELVDTVGSKITVRIHEIQDSADNRSTVIVSRKQILLDEFWNNLKIGEIVEGKVSSIATFGIFVDIGGVEGLVRLSRLSKSHITDAGILYKRGDKIKVLIHEIDKEHNRVSLSHKELEDNPWKNIESEFTVGSQYKGIVKKMTDFGAYIELKPGIDGLLRTGELSWTKRVKKPSDILTVNQIIDVEVLSVISEKQNMALSYKRTFPNPWNDFKERYPIGSVHNGKVTQVLQQGAIININDEIDGFMPKSKIKNAVKGKRLPFNTGDDIEVIIADLIPSDESLILAPKVEQELVYRNDDREPKKNFRSESRNYDNQRQKGPESNGGSFTLDDLLSEEDRKTLLGSYN